MLCLGIHGQSIYVDLDRAAVVVKLSSCPEPVDPVHDNAAIAIAEAICTFLG